MSSLPIEASPTKLIKANEPEDILSPQGKADSNRSLKEVDKANKQQANYTQANEKESNLKLNETNIGMESNKDKEKLKNEKLIVARLASVDTYLNWGVFTGWCVSIYCLFVWWVGLIGLVICASMFTAIRSIAFKVVARYSEELWRKYKIPILIMSLICFVWYGVVFVYLLEELIRQSYSHFYSLTNVFNSKMTVFYPMITSVIGIYLVLAPTFVLQLLALRNYRKLPHVIVKDEVDK
jgi:magnesium-transporting ATPase (P-type)